MATTQIRLFGYPTILHEGVNVDIQIKKAVALLAFLATTGKAISRERLAVILWPDANEEVARTSLRQALRAIRKTPLADAILTNRETIALDPAVETDVQLFQRYLQPIHTATPTPSTLTSEMVIRMQHAAALYQGDFMDEFTILGSAEWDDWQQFRRIEFQYQVTKLFATLAQYYSHHQLIDSGVGMAARWLELDPYNEEAHRLKIHLYALSRQTERAIEQYHLLVRLLTREHNRPPEAQTQQLYDQVRQKGSQYAETDIPRPKGNRSLLPKPMPLPHQYASASAQIKALFERLNTHPSPSVIVVHSNDPNTTALIAQITHDPDVQGHFEDGVLWAMLDHDLDAVVRLWLDVLRISTLKSTSKLEHLAWQLHNGLRGKRILIVLENVADPNIIRLLAPGSSGCILVVTTDQAPVAQNLEANQALLIELSPLPLADHQPIAHIS